LYAAILAAALLVADSPRVSANSESTFTEMIMINVNCSDASVMTTLTVGSDNDTLMHFPSSVNLNDAHLDDATTVAVISSSERSILTYTFEGISETEAETNAEAITPSIEAAVSIDFAYNVTGTIDTTVDVNYTGPDSQT
jgi:hypothetical protein